MNNRKGQAALEFLMTYGWAILVVLVAIGALAYFGVLSPDKFLPSTCTLPPGIGCADFQVIGDTGGVAAATSDISVVLRNGIGQTIDIEGITVAGCGLAANTDIAPALPTSILNGQQQQFTLTCQGAADADVSLGQPTERFTGDLSVTYTNADSGLTKTTSGSIAGQLESR